jgi:hypothetical protein
MAACLLFTFSPLSSNASGLNEKSSANVTLPVESEKVKANILLLRLDEIKAMDKSEMKPSDKQKLRKEVRSINNELKALGGGVYLSVGAIIIILLLLIIIF